MKLYTYFDDTYYPLFLNLLQTLQDDYEVFAMKTEPMAGRHTFYKPLLVEQAIKENMGDIIIISDSDVQFFSKTHDLVELLLTNREIAVQYCKADGYNEINIGFMAIRCCPRMVNLWRKVRIAAQQQRHDEAVVNEYLKFSKDIPWGFFPETIWADAGGSPPKDVILQHVVGVGTGTGDSVQRKLNKMLEAKKNTAKPYTLMPIPEIKKPILLSRNNVRH